MTAPTPPRSPSTHAAASAAVRVRAWVDEAARDPYWLPRALLLALLTYFLVRHVADPAYRGVYGGANLVVHEAGHALFSWSGSTTLTVLGGTLLEVALPVLVSVMFIRQRDPFAVTVSIFWLATALLDVSVYMGDARDRILPLVTMGEGPAIHDWHYLLRRAGLLDAADTLARLVRDLGLLTMGGSILAGAWVVSRIRKRARNPGDDRAGSSPLDETPGPGTSS